MTRRRYHYAFFALGWLILGGLAFERGAGQAVRGTFASMQNTLAAFGQSLSDREADAREKVQPQTRRSEVAKRYADLSLTALRAPASTLYGIYDGALPSSFDGLTKAEERLGHRFALISIYQAWGDRPDQAEFPLRSVSTIDRLGSVPVITWEPWVKDFDGALRPNLPAAKEREYASLAAIARGDYDFYVTKWATEAARYGKPIFLRFAHEMNDPYRYPWGPQNGNRPDDFIAAWRHVHQVFQKMSATNVLWVWSPHISMPWFEYYYPGDEFVDWISTGVLNYGDSATWSRWWSFHQIVEKSYPALVELKKPIMISEFGTLTMGGDAGQWYAQAFRDMREKYPAIRAVVLFNQANDVTLSTAPLNWSPMQDVAATRVVTAALHDPGVRTR